MELSKLGIGKVAIGWAILLIGAAVALPSIDSHVAANPIAQGIIAACCVVLMVATPIALTSYCNRAWREVNTVPNRAAYITWLALESFAGLAVLASLMYLLIPFAVARLR